MINMENLKDAIRNYAPCLSEEEVLRNARFIRSRVECIMHDDARKLCECCTKKRECDFKHG